MTSIKCPCGTGKMYIDCCAKAHQNRINAKTAEELMRSRYSAFVLVKGDYLMESHHSATRQLERKQELIDWAKSVKWIKLGILNTSEGAENDTEGMVEFKAHFKEGNKKMVLHEKSKFVREFGQWVYFGIEN
ncbi:MAG: Sec-C motif domain protein [Crocinitomicaceae bacterium]|nr:Sec-C motif domain protein [Crocinitomicaceae bacterium]